jgi:hypothetical protein
VKQLNQAVGRLDTTILSDHSLSNLTIAMDNFRWVSESAREATDNINEFLRTNTPSLSGSISNFGAFSEQLNQVTVELHETLATNRVQLTDMVKDLGTATGHLNTMLERVEAGEGLAGSLLHDEELALYTGQMLSNFMVLSSNINNKGLWGVIRKPKTKD